MYDGTGRVDGVAWGTSEQQRTHGRAGTQPVGQNDQHDRTIQVSPAEPVPPRCPNGHGLISFGESRIAGHRNGNTRGHPGAVQEADPQPRVRAVESE